MSESLPITLLFVKDPTTLFNTILLYVGSILVTNPYAPDDDWDTFSPSWNLLDTFVEWLNETISVEEPATRTVPEYFLVRNLWNNCPDFGQSFKSCKFSLTKKNVQYNVESPYSLDATTSGRSPSVTR